MIHFIFLKKEQNTYQNQSQVRAGPAKRWEFSLLKKLTESGTV